MYLKNNSVIYYNVLFKIRTDQLSLNVISAIISAWSRGQFDFVPHAIIKLSFGHNSSFNSNLNLPCYLWIKITLINTVIGVNAFKNSPSKVILKAVANCYETSPVFTINPNPFCVKIITNILERHMFFASGVYTSTCVISDRLLTKTWKSWKYCATWVVTIIICRRSLNL